MRETAGAATSSPYLARHYQTSRGGGTRIPVKTCKIFGDELRRGMEILFQDGQVIIPLPKAVLVMSRAEFMASLKRGKAWRRRAALKARFEQVSEVIDLPAGPSDNGVAYEHSKAYRRKRSPAGMYGVRWMPLVAVSDKSRRVDALPPRSPPRYREAGG
jgi:hypothetical protein